MMFRQILVHPHDRKYQQILWRYERQQPIMTYTLNTLTFGTKCAPYLSTRCLLQLAIDNEESYPKTAQIIKNSFYIDDLLVSVDTIEEALQLYKELTVIFSTAGFQLRKWSSNNQRILYDILGNGNNDEKLVQFCEGKELKTLDIKLTLLNVRDDQFNLFTRYSTLSKLQRVVAYCFKFKNITLGKNKTLTNILSVSELEISLTALIKIAQHEQFSQEIRLLQKSQPLNNNSKLIFLHPFLDEHGVIRVGGRLKNSLLNYENQFPIILCGKHIFTKLIIKHEHLKHLHAGTQNVLSIIRLKYWPIHGKNAVKSVIRSCVRCFRANPKPTSFLMGNLPTARVIPSRTFSNSGKAFDTLFKLFHVLNLNYPQESEHIYLIIQKAVYKIDTPYDKNIPSIMDVVRLGS
ncbi:hypothetical protein PPYR_01384 [Photinus pyralis]|uniref:Uncharacterized protein n=1 Tax=Photinus pyralis TaxID=7054 RepID=A0A5N4B4D7_PHOPY|nr:hypothetical protein PPYR_01384 [Photinus pyralis]